ncbi:hypothetical protein Tco_1429196 [Tanacetum coccineum]
MASDNSDQGARYALSKLLQMGTVAEYESEFVVLANRVTGISESLLISFYISGLKLTLQIDLLRARPTTLGEAFALARITEPRFEDERDTTVIAKPNDLNIAVQVQDIEETTLHTSNKVEAVSTSMVATSEEHGYQDGFCIVATYEEQECQDGLKPVTTRSPAGKKGDLGAITSKGGPPDHMRASEKELDVLKSLLKKKSMFRRQERMLRRQEQQRLAKDAKIQKRIWDPEIKSIQDNTLRASDQDARYALSNLLQMGTVVEYESEFVVLANRVTGISESLLTSFYIFGLKLTLQIDLLRARPKTLGEAFDLARIIESCFEDERATTVEAVSTSMVATYEEHGCQYGFCMVATYEEYECQDGLKPVTTRSSAGKKGNLGAITSKGGPLDHMRASEKKLVVLKFPLEQKSMFRRQERMLIRQEQQRLAKDAKIQRRIWDPEIKSI